MVDPGHEVLQVFTDPFELNTNDRGDSEDDASWQRWTSAFPAWTRGGEVNLKVKSFETGQCGEVSDDLFG